MAVLRGGAPGHAEVADVYLPWSAFKPKSLRTPLDPSTLERIGVAAAGAAFDAIVAISRLELLP